MVFAGGHGVPVPGMVALGVVVGHGILVVGVTNGRDFVIDDAVQAFPLGVGVDDAVVLGTEVVGALLLDEPARFAQLAIPCVCLVVRRHEDMIAALTLTWVSWRGMTYPSTATEDTAVKAKATILLNNMMMV